MPVLISKPAVSQSNQMGTNQMGTDPTGTVSTEISACCSSATPSDVGSLTLPIASCRHVRGVRACPFAPPASTLRRSPDKRLTAREEQDLFREIRRLRQQLEELVPVTAGVSREDRMEAMRLGCRACSIRRYLGHCYFKLAVSVARTFAARFQDIDDLVGQACVTLMRAIDLFDEERGYRFSTYATRAIRTELSRYVRRGRRQADLAVDPLILARRPSSRARRQHPGPAAYCALEDLLDDLAPREADIIRSRFGLHDRPGHETLQSVANRLGISRERVRQLERAALKKLRHLAEQDELLEAAASV